MLSKSFALLLLRLYMCLRNERGKTNDKKWAFLWMYSCAFVCGQTPFLASFVRELIMLIRGEKGLSKDTKVFFVKEQERSPCQQSCSRGSPAAVTFWGRKSIYFVILSPLHPKVSEMCQMMMRTYFCCCDCVLLSFLYLPDINNFPCIFQNSYIL